MVWHGIRFMRGTQSSKDTLGMAIASLGGGLLALISAFRDLSRTVDLLPPGFQVAEHVLLGAVGLSAGVLFLWGREAYRAWWSAEKVRKEREGTDADSPFRK